MNYLMISNFSKLIKELITIWKVLMILEAYCLYKNKLIKIKF